MAAQDVKTACRDFVDGKDAEYLVIYFFRVINSCARPHIERCTSSILSFIGTTDRTTALCKFLVALSKTQPSTKRLHILYATSDVCLAVQQHRVASDNWDVVLSVLKHYLPLLLVLATPSDPAQDAKTYTDRVELISVWYENGLFQPDEILGLYDRVLEAETTAYSKNWEEMKARIADEEAKVTEELERKLEDAKWTLPKRHGVPNDPNAPWYELPAANGLYMRRTRGYPLRSYALPQGGYELGSGVDRSQLKIDVEKLHSEMLHAFDKYTNADAVQDIDALGNIIYKDPQRPTRNYWGWSLDGIEKRRELAKDFQDKAIGYADIPVPRRPAPVDADVERARRMATERASGMGRGRGGGGGRGGMGQWRGGGGYGGRGGRGY